MLKAARSSAERAAAMASATLMKLLMACCCGAVRSAIGMAGGIGSAGEMKERFISA